MCVAQRDATFKTHVAAGARIFALNRYLRRLSERWKYVYSKHKKSGRLLIPALDACTCAGRRSCLHDATTDPRRDRFLRRDPPAHELSDKGSTGVRTGLRLQRSAGLAGNSHAASILAGCSVPGVIYRTPLLTSFRKLSRKGVDCLRRSPGPAGNS
jgi:hypothetical protein